VSGSSEFIRAFLRQVPGQRSVLREAALAAAGSSGAALDGCDPVDEASSSAGVDDRSDGDSATSAIPSGSPNPAEGSTGSDAGPAGAASGPEGGSEGDSSGAVSGAGGFAIPYWLVLELPPPAHDDDCAGLHVRATLHHSAVLGGQHREVLARLQESIIN